MCLRTDVVKVDASTCTKAGGGGVVEEEEESV